MLKDQKKHSDYVLNRITMVFVTEEVAKKANLALKIISYF